MSSNESNGHYGDDDADPTWVHVKRVFEKAVKDKGYTLDYRGITCPHGDVRVANFFDSPLMRSLLDSYINERRRERLVNEWWDEKVKEVEQLVDEMAKEDPSLTPEDLDEIQVSLLVEAERYSRTSEFDDYIEQKIKKEVTDEFLDTYELDERIEDIDDYPEEAYFVVQHRERSLEFGYTAWRIHFTLDSTGNVMINLDLLMGDRPPIDPHNTAASRCPVAVRVLHDLVRLFIENVDEDDYDVPIDVRRPVHDTPVARHVSFNLILSAWNFWS